MLISEYIFVGAYKRNSVVIVLFGFASENYADILIFNELVNIFDVGRGSIMINNLVEGNLDSGADAEGFGLADLGGITFGGVTLNITVLIIGQNLPHKWLYIAASPAHVGLIQNSVAHKIVKL